MTEPLEPEDFVASAQDAPREPRAPFRPRLTDEHLRWAERGIWAAAFLWVVTPPWPVALTWTACGLSAVYLAARLFRGRP